MTYRELVEMIEVLLTEEQKDQRVVYMHFEYGICRLYDLKISKNKYIEFDFDRREYKYPAGTVYLSGQEDSQNIDEMENG